MSGPVITNRQRRHRVPIRRLKRFAQILARRLHVEHQEFTLLLTNDRAIRRLNRQFRHKDSPTDVLSFPAETVPPPDKKPRQSRRLPLAWRLAKRPGVQSLARPPGTGLQPSDPSDSDPLLLSGGRLDNPYLGDMIVSVETAWRQAFERNHSLERELCVLMIHGLLHLLGYDHEVDRGEMRRKELRLHKELL